MNQQTSRNRNQAQVLAAIWETPGITRVEIADHLPISEPTVSRVVRELIQLGYVREDGPISDGNRGKNRVTIQPIPDARHILAIKPRRHGTKVAVLGLDGSIREVYETTVSGRNLDDFFTLLKQQFGSYSKQYTFAGVGICIPGVVETKTGVVKKSSVLGWRDFNVKAEVEDRLGVPCYAINNAKAAMLGERWLGAGKGTDDLLYLWLSDGIGASFLSRGELVEGYYAMAGEISASLIEAEEPLYRQFLSENLTRKVREAEAVGQETELSADVAQRGLITFQNVIIRALNGDSLATKVVEQSVVSMMPTFYNLMVTVDPQRVICGGLLGSNEQLFVRPFRAMVEKFDLEGLPPFSDRIIAGQINENESLFGAAWLVVRALLDGELGFATIEQKRFRESTA